MTLREEEEREYRPFLRTLLYLEGWPYTYDVTEAWRGDRTRASHGETVARLRFSEKRGWVRRRLTSGWALEWSLTDSGRRVAEPIPAPTPVEVPKISEKNLED